MAKRKTKYNASHAMGGEIEFDSAMERDFYVDIILPGIEAGEFSDVELQKPFELQPKFKRDGAAVRAIVYVADFYYKTADGVEHVVDVKGFADAQAKMKRKMFWYRYPDIDYCWLTKIKKFGGWITYEEAQRRRRDDRKSKGL